MTYCMRLLYFYISSTVLVAGPRSKWFIDSKVLLLLMIVASGLARSWTVQTYGPGCSHAGRVHLAGRQGTTTTGGKEVMNY